MKNIFLQIFCSIVLLTSSARAFTLGELWVGQYDSFPMGACDDERGWFALRCWTAEIDVNLEAGESGLYVLEWSPDLVTWSELNNNPDIAFPPHASFNGTMNLPGPGTWTMVYPSPPVDVMFLRLKRLGDYVPPPASNEVFYNTPLTVGSNPYSVLAHERNVVNSSRGPQQTNPQWHPSGRPGHAGGSRRYWPQRSRDKAEVWPLRHGL